VCILLLLVPIPGSAGKRNDPGVIPPQSVSILSTAASLIGEACVFFIGSIEAGDFFRVLRRTNSPDGPIFKKGPQVLTDYPDEVCLNFETAISRCSKDLKYIGDWPTGTPDFLRSMRAESRYMRDLRSYPLETVLAKEGTCDILGVETVWCYRFLIKTKGVRLTDKLVVTLFLKDGTRAGEFIVDLAGKTDLW
jgi:hypothetical protein